MTGGWQARWAQPEQGRAVRGTLQSYIYSKEVTSSILSEQLICYEGQLVLRESLNEGTGTNASLTHRLEFGLSSFFVSFCASVRKFSGRGTVEPDLRGQKANFSVDPSAL